MAKPAAVWEIMESYGAAQAQMRAIREEVGPLLKVARENQGLGLRELARLADVSPGLLSLIERNLSWCPKVALAAAEVLKLTHRS